MRRAGGGALPLSARPGNSSARSPTRREAEGESPPAAPRAVRHRAPAPPRPPASALAPRLRCCRENLDLASPSRDLCGLRAQPHPHRHPGLRPGCPGRGMRDAAPQGRGSQFNPRSSAALEDLAAGRARLGTPGSEMRGCHR
ncbi:potassium/sodium hyperpolarization-activated cyclic nucleotide-gated channel 2-like isoform X2 [Pezoporus occidentalis]|uniref:potassium/sodium hyperpolarization-activated cyclic nucleotide-gated channel 2-like isoform X2 n=1 Tax=Pezoporus occidentalis TaxID=407982 RepID=UPI002F916975